MISSTNPHLLLRPAEISLWAFVQLAAVLLGASNLPLWAHHPLPHASLALHEWLAVEMVSGAMLVSLIASNYATLLANIFLSLGFAESAGIVANQPQTVIIAVWIYGSVWLTGLFGWTRQIDPAARPLVSALAMLCAVGAAIISYLHGENMLSNGDAITPFVQLGPLAGALADLPHVSWICWIEVAIPLLISAGIRCRNLAG